MPKQREPRVSGEESDLTRDLSFMNERMAGLKAQLDTERDIGKQLSSKLLDAQRYAESWQAHCLRVEQALWQVSELAERHRLEIKRLSKVAEVSSVTLAVK